MSRIVPVLAACLATLAASLAVGGSDSAVAAQDRAQLRAMISDARADLRSAATQIPRLTKQDTRIVRGQLDVLRAHAGTASDALTAARGQAELETVSRLIRTLSRQSRSLRQATHADAQALSHLAATRAASGELLLEWRAGRLSDAAYRRQQGHWALAGAHATRDQARAVNAIIHLTPPPAATAAQAIAQAERGAAPSRVPGLTPVPGGCALPTAERSTFIGAAASPGLHLWTSDAQVAAHRERLQNPTPALASANRHVLAQADAMVSTPPDTTSGGTMTVRALRIGYAWLATQDPEYARVLESDLTAVTATLAPAEELVDEAKIAMAAATNANWLSPAANRSLERRLLVARQVLLVRSLGEMSCAIALRSDLITGSLNKAVTIGSGAAVTALAVARDDPSASAAIVAAALRAARPGMRALWSDGGSAEGPTYWNFQTVPLAGLLSSLDSVLDGASAPGLRDFRAAAVFAYHAPAAPPSPSATQVAKRGGSADSTATQVAKRGGSADSTATQVAWQVTRYSDTDTGELRCTLPAWIAGRWGGSEAIALALRGTLRQGVELLWWPAAEVPVPEQTSTAFPTTGLVVVHSGPATAWLKGQAPLNTHTQLDAGTVGLTIDGVEWTMDPGYGPKIDSPGYSDDQPGGRRWTYPQTQPHWHSTVRSGAGLGQQVGSTAAVSLDAGIAHVDLSRALTGVTAAHRTVALEDRSLVIRDEVSSGRPRALAWGWMTDADLVVSGNRAYLTKNGRTLTIRWTGLPAGSVVAAVDVPESLRYLTGRRTTLLSVTIPATSSLDLTTLVEWS